MSVPVDLRPLQGVQGAQRESALGSLEQQLLCPICLDVFTKPVVILPCQHNLCRRCANELYQPSLFQARTTMLVSSGRFRCPTCRQEVVLDRHGVFGLQRNLLVESIIDVYKQQLSAAAAAAASSPPAPLPVEEVTCADHQGEKLNIYCLSCQQPTCSLCKVFGSHRLCQVSPLAAVHQQQKAELELELSSLMAKNDRIQTIISDLELTWRTIEENSRSQKQRVCDQFDAVLSVLAERQKVMTQRISSDEEDKTGQSQTLMRCYGDSVEANNKLLETASKTLEETDMAAFVQNSEELISNLRASTGICPTKTVEPDGENLTHYRWDFSRQERALRRVDFIVLQKKVPTELQPDEQRHLVEVQPDLGHHLSELQPEQECSPTELQPNQELFPTELQPNQELFPTELQPNQELFPTELQPHQELFPTELQPHQELFPTELQPNQELFPTELQPQDGQHHLVELQPEEGQHHLAELQPEDGQHHLAELHPEERQHHLAELQPEEEPKVEESKPNLEPSAEVLAASKTIPTVTQPQPGSAVQNLEEGGSDRALEPVLAFTPPLPPPPPPQTGLDTADPLALVLGAVMASLEPPHLAPEQQMDNLRLNGQTVLKERRKGGADESREEETQEDRKQVETFRTPDSIKEVQCEDQDGMNTQQAVILLFYVLAFLLILQRMWSYLGCFMLS